MFPARPNYSENLLTADLTATDTDIADLKFSNLVVGKTYMLSGQVRAELHNDASIVMNNDTEIYTVAAVDNFSGGLPDMALFWSVSIVFIAAATSVTFDYTHGTASTVYGNSTNQETYLRLLKL